MTGTFSGSRPEVVCDRRMTPPTPPGSAKFGAANKVVKTCPPLGGKTRKTRKP